MSNTTYWYLYLYMYPYLYLCAWVGLLDFRGVHLGTSHNAELSGSAAIDYGLLQFFSDNLQCLQSRSDSTMMLNEMRRLRAELVGSGVSESDLPNFDNSAAKQWFYKWRKRHGIKMKVTGMQLKVSWRKVIQRCRVFLTNVFRLRFFFELCHKEQGPFDFSWKP